jgi:hypothetical protein
VGLDDPDPHPLAGRGAGDEGHPPAAVAPDRVAARRQRRHLELDELVHAVVTSTGSPRAMPSTRAASRSRTAISIVPAEPT